MAPGKNDSRAGSWGQQPTPEVLAESFTEGYLLRVRSVQLTCGRSVVSPDEQPSCSLCWPRKSSCVAKTCVAKKRLWQLTIPGTLPQRSNNYHRRPGPYGLLL